MGTISGQNDFCTPSCGSANQCMSDGCGDLCPCTTAGYVCNADSVCVSADENCLETCGTTWECGSVCGNYCGTCAAGMECIAGKCECKPECDNVRCGQDDGCGVPCGCTGDKICDEVQGICVDNDDPCAGRECGTFGGKNCGTCQGANAVCSDEGVCSCEPFECNGRCGDDGCGGDCGDCSESPGTVCNADGVCVTGECSDTCADVGWQCDGNICGNDCGTCGEGEVCQNHVCVCQPACAEDDCGDDGCGRTCRCQGSFEGYECDPFTFKCVENCNYTCEEQGWDCGEICGNSCGECTGGDVCAEGHCSPAFLKMSLLGETSTDENGWTSGTLLIQYFPREGVSKPRMVDLRLMTDWLVNFEIDSIVPGMAMAGKDIYLDPKHEDQTPWRLRTDGSLQMLIYSLQKSDTYPDNLEEGDLVTINFRMQMNDPLSGIEQVVESVQVSLVRRDQVFAPFEADLALQDTAYDNLVTVTQ